MCTSKQSNKRSKGFTLIELLLVLGVISVLALGAFVIYPKSRNAAWGNEDRQNMRTTSAQIFGLFNGPLMDGLDTLQVQFPMNPVFEPLCEADQYGRMNCYSKFGNPIYLGILGGGGDVYGFSYNMQDVSTEQCLETFKSGVTSLGAYEAYNASGSGAVLNTGSSPTDVANFCANPADDSSADIEILYWSARALY